MIGIDLLRNGKKLDFHQYKTGEELDEVLRTIFTNNPSHWDNSPLYLNYDGDLNNIVKAMLAGQVNVFEHEFSFVWPDYDKQEESELYDYCREISKVRTNILLPLVYYNAILYLDKLHLSPHKVDTTSKLMRIRRNKYDSILNEIKNNYDNPFYLYYHLRDNDKFADLEESTICECGSVNAYRVEMSLIYNESNHIIFPFPIDEDEAIGKMYYCQLLGN